MSLLDGFPDLANLDNKTFEDLVNEARALLIRYSREWTDHNITDPGITFIELFAWLAEMQIYQLNRVTDANCKKFLKLMGFYQIAAQPARVDVIFKSLKDYDTPIKAIKAGTQIITEVDSEKIVFEIEEDLTLTGGNIKSIITAFNSQIIDNTRANEPDDIYFAPFGEKAEKGATLSLGLDKAFPEKEIKITFYLFEDDLPPLSWHEENEPSVVLNSVSLEWKYRAGKDKWNVLPVKNDTTMALKRSGRIVFEWPSDMVRDDKNIYWIRCCLKEGTYEIVPLINRILLDTVSAVQVETIIKEPLGEKQGVPGQFEILKKTPIINRILFDIEDIIDWHNLVKEFNKRAILSKANPVKRIFNMLDQKTQVSISEWKGDSEPSDVLKCEIIESLNKMLDSPELYDFDSYKGINLFKLPNKFLMCLFDWTKIPENEYHTCRLIDFFSQNLDIGWIKNARVKVKKADDTTIEISDGLNCILLKLNVKNTKVDVIISDNIIAELIVKTKNGNRNIYYLTKKFSFSSGTEVKTLNRFLIEAAFPEIIVKNRLVIQAEKIDGECEYWYEVDNFDLSGPDDTHYIFDPETNEVTIGNGLNGRILSQKWMIKASYKTTLGPKGNIPKNQKFRINDSKFNMVSGINLKAATGGREAETLDDAKIRVRNDSTKIYRAITSGDYEYLAGHTPGLRVARAKAISGYNHEFPSIKMPGMVTVIVIPYMREGNINPIAGDVFRQTILQHLNKHRLITTNVDVIGPEYVKISIKCTIYIISGKSPTRVEEEVKKRLDRFLDPLRGGPDGKGWSFGRPVYPSEIFQIIDKVDGVDYATDVSFIDKNGNYYNDIAQISPISLVYPGEHHLKIIER